MTHHERTDVPPISPETSDSRQPRRVLITGGAGFLGINLARLLDSRGVQVSSIDLAPFDYEDMNDRVTAIAGDIRDAAAVARAMEGVRRRGAHRCGAAALPTEGHLHHGCRGHAHGPSRGAQGRHRAGGAHFLHRRLWHPGPPPALRGRSPRRRWPLRAGQDPGGDGLPRSSIARHDRADPAPQELRRAGAARRLRAALRLGAGGAQLPDDRQRQQPLPAARRGRPLRGDLAHAHTAGRDGKRHLQHRRGRVRDDEARLPGGARCRRARQAHYRLPGRTDDLDAANPREAGHLAALHLGVRDGEQGLLRQHREGAAPARLATAVQQPGRPAAQLRLVPGQPGSLRQCQRRLPPRALEAGQSSASPSGCSNRGGSFGRVWECFGGQRAKRCCSEPPRRIAAAAVAKNAKPALPIGRAGGFKQPTGCTAGNTQTARCNCTGRGSLDSDIRRHDVCGRFTTTGRIFHSTRAAGARSGQALRNPPPRLRCAPRCAATRRRRRSAWPRESCPPRSGRPASSCPPARGRRRCRAAGAA